MRIQKAVNVFLLFFVLLLALAACGGTDTSPDTSSQVTSARTPTIPLPDQNEVLVSLHDNKILPTQTTFKLGIPYRFVVANVGKKHHGFVILLAVLNVAQMTRDDLQKAALVIVDDLAPGGSMLVDYTFPASAVGGNYEMTSTLPADYQAGLKVPITVTAKK